MKRNYLLTCALAFSIIGSKAQTVEITDLKNNSVVLNNTQIINETRPGTTATHYFQMKNISSSSQVFSIRKTVIQMNKVAEGDSSVIYFCTGVDCFDASVTSNTVQIAAGDTVRFTADLDEATVAGSSKVEYKFSANGESIILNMIYNASPVAIAKNASVFSNISGVYPNPASSKAYIAISSPREVSGVRVAIINSLGAKVSNKEVSLSNGKNVISLDTENLSPGIYFVSVNYGSNVVTKKITVVN
jgi:hypothetical protein